VVRTVRRAIQILELIAERGPLGVSGIGRALRVPKSSAHNILETLAHHRARGREDRSQGDGRRELDLPGPWLP
jgi:DNA-binding IclR family transcriptional regulator